MIQRNHGTDRLSVLRRWGSVAVVAWAISTTTSPADEQKAGPPLATSIPGQGAAAYDGAAQYLQSIQSRNRELERQMQIQSEVLGYRPPAVIVPYRFSYRVGAPPISIYLGSGPVVPTIERRAYRGYWEMGPTTPGAYAYPYWYPYSRDGSPSGYAAGYSPRGYDESVRASDSAISPPPLPAPPQSPSQRTTRPEVIPTPPAPAPSTAPAHEDVEGPKLF